MPSWNPFKKEKQKQPAGEQQYAPPPGPPPNYTQQQSHGYAPSSSAAGSGYAPPPGPPPSRTYNPNNPFVDYTEKKQAPPQPQPQADPPTPTYQYHDWTSVPDTALLPPPPPLANDTSPTANATAESGEAAFHWCNAYPLRPPYGLTPAHLAALAHGHITLAMPPPPSFVGELHPHSAAPGRYLARSAPRCADSCLTTALPLYAALAHGGAPKTIYFELQVLSVGGGAGSGVEEADAGVALGYVAQPYPTWRLPGWQRGSLGVHGDDGRRYVNDTFGGVDFTTAFCAVGGERVGLGMVFSAPRGGQQRPDVEVFFTRGGERKGGWDLHEELDERAIGGTEGLNGECDIFGAVGVFGAVEFEVFFNRADWLYRPEGV